MPFQVHRGRASPALPRTRATDWTFPERRSSCDSPPTRWLLAGLFLSIATGAAVVIQESSAKRAWNTEVWTGSGLSNPTGEELFALVDALKKKVSLPGNAAIGDWKGECSGTLSGIRLPSGEFNFIVTAVDDLTDMETMTVTVDGELKFTGTRQSGEVVDRGNFAVGTASLMLQPGLPIEIEVEWVDGTGEAVRHVFAARP